MKNVSNVVPKIAIDFVKDVAKRENAYGEEALFALIHRELVKQWPERDQRQIFAGRMRLDSDDNIRAAIYAFRQTLNWSDILEGGVRMRKISEDVVPLIDKIVTEEKEKNANKDIDNDDEVLALFRDYVYRVYEEAEESETDGESSKNSEVSTLEKMGIRTTKDIKYAVDMYIVHKSLGYTRKKKQRSRKEKSA